MPPCLSGRPPLPYPQRSPGERGRWTRPWPCPCPCPAPCAGHGCSTGPGRVQGSTLQRGDGGQASEAVPQEGAADPPPAPGGGAPERGGGGRGGCPGRATSWRAPPLPTTTSPTPTSSWGCWWPSSAGALKVISLNNRSTVMQCHVLSEVGDRKMKFLVSPVCEYLSKLSCDMLFTNLLPVV